MKLLLLMRDYYISLETKQFIENKWLLLNGNTYLKPYNYKYYLEILKTNTKLCEKYVNLVGILDAIK